MNDSPPESPGSHPLEYAPAARKTGDSGWLLRAGGWTLLVLVFGVLALRQNQIISENVVNLMIWDQWDFYRPIFQDQNLWRLFDQQHGPHREGLGLLITEPIARLSNFNSRADAFAASYVLMLAAALAVMLALRCRVPIAALFIVPVAFFNCRQFETFLGAANLSYSTLPMLLFMMICLAWFIRGDAVRLAIICILTFVSIFTGFAIFLGMIVPLVILAELIWSVRNRQKPRVKLAAAALAAVALSWMLFFRGYVFAPAVGGFYFPYKKPMEYFYFMALMLANYFGISSFSTGAIAAGSCIAGILLIILLIHGIGMVRNGPANRPVSTVIFSLACFALVYCAFTAAGRVFFGLQTGPYYSRYLTLMIPAAMAIFLHFSTLASKRLSMLLTVFLAIVLIGGTATPTADDLILMRGTYHDARLQWKITYIATGDEKRATQASHGFSAYPLPGLHDRIAYFEQHRLNLFDDNVKP